MTTALERCEKARKLWLSATCLDDLDQVETLYREALNSKRRQRSDDPPPRKKNKNVNKKSNKYAELSADDYRQTGERLSLLYCQSGRTQKAKKGLSYLGFMCRLATHVLDYPMPTTKHIRHSSNNSTNNHRTLPSSTSSPPCVIYDNFLMSHELDHLKSIFENPKADYWSYHDYHVEPPSPYFSYVIPLQLQKKKEGKQSIGGGGGNFVHDLARKIWKHPGLNKRFPALAQATYVEMWAHNRPHASGHQMHFDSDDEGRGGVIRNPIVSTILYVTAEGGGPSLVTNQRLDSTKLASKGWLAHPKARRLVAFDGRVLHGVVPGKGISKIRDGRRVTLMFAFWKKIQIRREATPGSARPFPLPPPSGNDADADDDDSNNNIIEWAVGLSDPTIRVQSDYSKVKEQQPVELDHVYETLDGNAWNPRDGMLDYEQVFQGF